MEVVLKRTKITKSILDQSVYASKESYIKDIEKILGWCMYKGNRLILLYDKHTSQILKLDYVDKLGYKKFEQELHTNFDWNSHKLYHIISIKYSRSNVEDRIFSSQDEKETNISLFMLKEFLKKVHEKGQIYI